MASEAVVATSVLFAADDFVINVYHNGQAVPDSAFKLEREIFGATVMRVQIDVQRGDWLVFEVVNDRFRWKGSCGFAAAGLTADGEVAFATDTQGGQWSACDSSDRASRFISEAGYLSNNGPSIPTNPWARANDEMSSRCDWSGKIIWGAGDTPHVWIKYYNPAGPGQSRPNSDSRGSSVGSVSAATQPSELALEIESLRALDDLQATPAQLVQLRDASMDAVTHVQMADLDIIDQAAAKDSACYALLLRLRESLLRGDSARIEQGEQELAGLEQKIQINFTPRIVPSPAAQKSAGDVTREFSGGQIAAYIARRSEEVSDPTEVLLGALIQCRGMSVADFQRFDLDVTQQVSELVAGMAQSPTRPIARRTSELLKLAHSLGDADFDNQRPDLENQARDITKVDASTALRHWMECEMAQLLSNPQLPLALADRSSWSREAASTSQGVR
jgi:hypothetical protein